MQDFVPSEGLRNQAQKFMAASYGVQTVKGCRALVVTYAGAFCREPWWRAMANPVEQVYRARRGLSRWYTQRLSQQRLAADA